MTPSTVAASAHVEAYRCTGTSPGRSGVASRDLPRDSTRYEAHGHPTARPVVVLGGISAGRHLAPTPDNEAPGWWPDVIGSGRALDPDRHRLVGVDFLTHPGVTSQDQARAVAHLLDELDIERTSLIGSSYGGMVALAFAELFPERTERLVVFCAAHRTHPMATALRSIQRKIVRFAREHGDPARGLGLARSLAMTTYRSTEEFDTRFGHRALRESGPIRFPVEEYLEARGDAFAGAFQTNSFLRLSESIDRHEIDPAALLAPTILVSFDSDVLVPPWIVDELSAGAPGVELHLSLSSVFGHDAFLKETDLVSDVLREVLR